MKLLRAFASCLAVFLACFASTPAAVAAVAQLGGPAQINNNTSLAYTVPAGTNRLLVVNASASDLNNLSTITGVTFNGTPMILAVKRDDTSVAVDSLWYLPMGTSGSSTAGTVVVTSTVGTVTAVGAVTYQGVDQAAPTNGAQSAILTQNNAGSSLNIVSTSGDLVMDLFDIYDPTQVGTETPGAGQTVIHDIDAPAGSLYGYYKTSSKAGAASTTMSWTSNGSAMIHVAMNIKQAPLPFTAGNVVVLRAGDGTGTNTTTTTANGYLVEYTPTGTLVQSVPLPNLGPGQATVSGGAQEGLLARTADGSRLYFGAYRAAAGSTAGGSTPASVPRVLGFVDSSASINTSTASTDAAGQIKSVTSAGGTGAIYMTTGSGGVRVMAAHGQTATTQIEALSARQVAITGSSLFVSNTVSGTAGVRSYGASLPSGATGSSLLTASGPSASGFVALDLSAGVAGDDTIYVANTPSSGQCTLEKYCFNGSSWVAFGTVNLPTNGAHWNMTGSASGSTATLYLVFPGFAGSTSTLQKFVDSSGYNATISGSFSQIASSPANAEFRGVAFAPAVTSTNADLSALTFSAGSISPGFAAGTTSYSFNVPNGTISTTVTATKADANASLQVQVNGGGFNALTSGTASGALSLNVGANTVDVKVTAQSGATKTYTTTITRATPPDLTVSVSHTPTTFVFGGSSNTINIVVTNSGGTATSGTITLDMVMPTGFTIQSVVSGSEWNATSTTSTHLIATSTNALAAGASASTVAVHVAVAANAALSTGVTATVSGGGETNTANDTGTDTIPVNTPPAVTSPTSASITHFTATLGGNVTSDGGVAVTERGVVLARTSQNSDPLIGGANVTKLTTTGTTGVFTLSASSLLAGTGYSYKAYATNSLGTTYTSVATFTTTALPNLTINDVSLAEGNAGTTNFTFTVSLSSAAPAGGVTFDIATADGTATTAGSDYTAKSLTSQTITAGNTSYSFTVVVNGDTAIETNETFFVNVTNVSNATVTDGQGQGTITNDDTAAAPTVTTPTAGGVSQFSATLGGNVTSDGGATITERGVVLARTAQNSDPLIGGANVTKLTTTGTTGVFTLNASGLSAGTSYSYKAYATNSTGTSYTSVATFNTTALPQLSINDVSLAEGNSGTTSFTFTVSLSGGAPAGGVTFDIATADGTATTAGSDYTAKSLTAQTIPAGNSTYSFTVLVNGDTAVESNETFFVNVTNVSNATVTDGQGQGTITNDDASAPTVTTPTSTGITQTAATLGGNVTSDGGAAITERGVVVSQTSLNNNPLIGGANVTKFTTTGTTGVFTLSATSLTANTGYSYKAYATNSTGTTYTSVSTFTTLAPVNDIALSLTGGNLIIDASGSPGATHVVIRFVTGAGGPFIEVFDPARTLGAGSGMTQVNANTVRVPVASVTGSIQLTGSNQADSFTLDFTNGDICPPGGITVNGGLPNTTPGDSMIIDGDFSSGGVYGAGGPGAGTLTLDSGNVVTFSGLEPIDLSGATFPNFTVQVDPGNTFVGNVITTVTAVDGNVNTLVSFSGGLESVKLGTVTGTLTILGDNAEQDYFALRGVGTAMVGDFVVDGQGGNADVIDIDNGTLALAAGKNLSLKADFIGLGRDAAAPPNDHPGVINVSGNITLEADGDSAIANPPLWGSGGVWGTSIPAYFSPSTLFTQRGSIQMRGDVTKTAGADATVTFRARAGVGFMNAGAVAGSITSTSNKLNVIIHADSDANNDGSVQMQNLTAVTTNGGDVTIGGGVDPTAGPAVGVAGGGATAGVLINNVNITTAGGNVSIRGKGFAGNSGFGVLLQGSSAAAGQPTISTDAGSLTIVGIGGGTAGANTNCPGVELLGVTSPLRIPQLLSTTGAINVTGTANFGNNAGVFLLSLATISTSGAAPITLTGTGLGVGFGIITSATPGNTVLVSSAGGNVTFVGDTMGLDGSTGTKTIQTSGSGIISIKPLTVGRAINIGGADSPTELGLNAAELASLTANTVTIGDSNSGPITVTAAIAPANFTTLAFGNSTTFSATGGFTADVTSAAAYEKVTVAGTLTITAGATFAANSVGGYVWNGTDTFTFVANDDVDAVSGTFTGPTLTNFLGSALTAQQSYVGGTGNDFVVGLGVPSITGVNPATAGTTGGTTITITGSGFTGTTGVTIGGTPATGVNVVNDTTITAVVPAGSLGTAAIVVTGPAGTGTGSGFFTYVPPPTLTLDRATVTVNEGGTASNSGVFGGVPGDTITIGASSGTVTQSPNGVWTFQQAFAVGGHPGDPALDNDGNLYVVLGQEKEVLKFNSAGTLVATFAFTFEPGGIAIDNANGIVYVTALTGAGSDKVCRYSLAGVELSSFASSGTGDGQLNTPYNIAIDPVGGNLYVVDKGNSRIQVFTPAGDFVRKWGSAGTGDGQFNFPQGIRVSTDGKVYVTDRNNNRIQYFDTDGNYLGQWGSAGTGNGQFNSPTGVSIDPSGNTYVSDLLNNRIQKFTATGGYLDQFGPGSGPGALNLPHGVAFPDNGRSLYVVNYGAANVVKYSTPGTWVWSASAADGPNGPTPVTITATDSTNGTSTQQVFSFTINNVAPAIALTGNATVTVGASYTLNLGAITDPGTDEVTAFAIDWGDGTPESVGAFPLGTKNHTYSTLGPKTIRMTLTDEDGTFSDASTLSITVLPLVGPPAVNDAVTTGTGPSVVYPLANDPTTETTIVSVSNPAITISTDGRSLQVPPNFTGSFTYTTSAGNTATVDVTAGTPVSAPRKYTGLLYDNTGALAGWASLSVSSRGSASVQVRVGTTTGRAVFSFNSTTATASTSTALGGVTLTRNADGTLAVGLAATGGSLTGMLFPAPTILTPVKYHVALASIDDTVPGGGILRVTLTSRGQVRLVATLPDGRPISVGAGVTDNGTVIFYGKESSRVNPPGVIGGQLVPANLALTDITGEILWNKPPQAQGSGGTQQAGVDTILVANGSIYAGALPPGMTNLAGTGTLTLSGGGFAAPEVSPVTLNGAIPTTPVGSLKNWAGVKVENGMFRCRIQVPGISKPVTGTGLYLPKSNRAWGYFPGATLGGRVELQGDGQ